MSTRDYTKWIGWCALTLFIAGFMELVAFIMVLSGGIPWDIFSSFNLTVAFFVIVEALALILGVITWKQTPAKVAVIGAVLSFACVLSGLLSIRMLFDRTRAFRAQAISGQPIVQAIEEYKSQTKNYPSALQDLVPKYLREIPEGVQDPNSEIGGWEYHTITNVTYLLKFRMGRGGVEYEPPNWVGNDEGKRKLILTNE